MRTYVVAAWDMDDPGGKPVKQIFILAKSEQAAIERGEQVILDLHIFRSLADVRKRLYFTATLHEE